MPDRPQRTTVRIAFAGLLLALSVLHLGVGSWRARARGIADFPIFLDRASAYLDTGVLYPDSDRPELYAPAAAVYKFPPLFATLLLPVARLPHGAVALGHWIVQLVAFLAAGGWLLGQLRRRAGPAALLAIALLWLNAEPFYETLWRQQLETYILVALVAALAAIRRDDDARAGFALGLVAALKVYPGMMLGGWLAARRWPALVGAVAAAGLATLGTLLVVGVEPHLRWAVDLLPLMLGETPFADAENVSLAGGAMRLGVAPATAGLLQRAVAVPALLAALWLAARRAGPGAGSVARQHALGLFVATTLVWMGNAWANYQVLLLVPLALVVADRRDGLAAARALAAVAACTLLFAIPCPREMIGQWPCAETPPWLGVAPLPRTLHDLLATTRVLATPLAWVAAAIALAGCPAPGAVRRGASRAA